MLSYSLYNLCSLLTSSFSCGYNKIYPDYSSYINLDVYKNLIIKNTFFTQWRKKLNHIYSNFHFSYDYKILDQYDNKLKIKLSISESFSLTNFSSNVITSACINNYILIIDYCDKAINDILIIISEEENPLLYAEYTNKNLRLINSAELKDILLKDTLLWQYKTKNISSIYDTLLNELHFKSQTRAVDSNFNIKNACRYAEKYALIPNPEYKNYEDSGGDCTNFVSQILHAGGINYSQSWKPYTNSWLRVSELYNYIIYNKLGKKLPDEAAFQKGSMIQFFTPKKGYYFHSGFITHVLPYNEAFYCCHSYNKLNYPLSEIYPVIYPGIRCIALK